MIEMVSTVEKMHFEKAKKISFDDWKTIRKTKGLRNIDFEHPEYLKNEN